MSLTVRNNPAAADRAMTSGCYAEDHSRRFDDRDRSAQ